VIDVRSLARWLGPAALVVCSATARAQEPPPEPPSGAGDGSVPRGGAGAIVVPAPDAPAEPGKVTLPRLKKYAAPVYPAKAAAAGSEGGVTLKLDIDAAGHVTRAIVETPGGHGFDEAALAAAPGLELEPARRADGTPVAARILYQYKFTLEPRAKASALPVPRADVETIAGRVLVAGTDAALAGIAVKLRRPDGSSETATSDAAPEHRAPGRG
jgi:TonB family protein